MVEKTGNFWLIQLLLLRLRHLLILYLALVHLLLLIHLRLLKLILRHLLILLLNIRKTGIKKALLLLGILLHCSKSLNSLSKCISILLHLIALQIGLLNLVLQRHWILLIHSERILIGKRRESVLCGILCRIQRPWNPCILKPGFDRFDSLAKTALKSCWVIWLKSSLLINGLNLLLLVAYWVGLEIRLWFIKRGILIKSESLLRSCVNWSNRFQTSALLSESHLTNWLRSLLNSCSKTVGLVSLKEGIRLWLCTHRVESCLLALAVCGALILIGKWGI